MAKIEMTTDLMIAHRGSFIDIPHHVWDVISNMYSMVSGKEILDVIWSAYDRLAYCLVDEANNREYDHVVLSRKYLMPRMSPFPLQLYFGEEADFTDRGGVPDGGILCLPVSDPMNPGFFLPDTYYLPTFIREVVRLQDYLKNPVMDLLGNVDDAAFDTTSSVIDNAKGTIVFNEDYYDIMWATSYKAKSLTELLERFGSLVGYSTRWENRFEEDVAYDLFGMLYVLYHGPTYENLELGLTILNNLPYSPYAGRVLNITPTELVLERSDNGRVVVIANDTGQDFMRRVDDVWTLLAVGDHVGPYTVLTDTIQVLSVIIDPTIMERIPYSFTQARNMFFVRLKHDDYELPEPDVSADFLERMRAFGTNYDIVMWMDIVPEVEVVTSAFRMPSSPEISLESANGKVPPAVDYDLFTWHAVVPPVPGMDVVSIHAMAPSIRPSMRMQTHYLRAPSAPGVLEMETSHE